MSILFNKTETHTPGEIISSYWHYLRSSQEAERSQIGSLELFLSTGAVIRGWPIGFKNQTLCLQSTADVTEATSIAYIDVNQVVGVGFSEAHRIIRFISGGAVARSPLEKKPAREKVQAVFLKTCEKLRELTQAKLYFDSDPNSLELDELINLTEVLTAFRSSVEQRVSQSEPAKALNQLSAIQISDADQPTLTISLENETEVEISFKFSRALPSNIREQVYQLVSGLM